jgi:cobalt-zinc-cadmium efflux system membrane fusion protein
MHRRSKLSLISVLSCLILLFYFSGCGNRKSGTGSVQKPAEVSNQVKENTLTTVRLSAEAENRLGIETRTAEIRTIPKTLILGGEVISPPGQEVKVTAPVAGMVSGTGGGYFPVAGSPVQKNQEILRLIVIPPEMDILSAEEDVRVKQMEYEVALAELIRAEKLLENKAISDKVFESTQARFARAEASLTAARGRLNLYQGKDIDSAAEILSTFTIESPVTGVIQNIEVTPGQLIASSVLLFEVSPLNRFWIRVPVYSGDLSSIDTGRKASVSTMGNKTTSGLLQADPIRGPLLSNAISASSYLYYEIDNRNGMLRSGQKVSVTLPLKSTGKNLAVPFSSIIYDIQGGTWVYVKSGPFVSIRTRVDLDHVSDSLAIIKLGISPGDEVVSAGAAELFGTEFGVGK